MSLSLSAMLKTTWFSVPEIFILDIYGMKNRRQKIESIYGTDFWSVCHGYNYVTVDFVMAIAILPTLTNLIDWIVRHLITTVRGSITVSVVGITATSFSFCCHWRCTCSVYLHCVWFTFGITRNSCRLRRTLSRILYSLTYLIFL